MMIRMTVLISNVVVSCDNNVFLLFSGMPFTLPQTIQVFPQMWHQLLHSSPSPSTTTPSSPAIMPWNMPSTMLSSMLSGLLQSSTTPSPSASLLSTPSPSPNSNMSWILSKYLRSNVLCEVLYQWEHCTEWCQTSYVHGASRGTSRWKIPELLPSCTVK